MIRKITCADCGRKYDVALMNEYQERVIKCGCGAYIRIQPIFSQKRQQVLPLWRKKEESRYWQRLP
jgi:hypothetical protein